MTAARTKLIEAMAESWWNSHLPCDEKEQWSAAYPKGKARDHVLRRAAAALGALASALPTLGLALVPTVATETMTAAAIPIVPEDNEDWSDHELFVREWAAMLAAAPDPLRENAP